MEPENGPASSIGFRGVAGWDVFLDRQFPPTKEINLKINCGILWMLLKETSNDVRRHLSSGHRTYECDGTTTGPFANNLRAPKAPRVFMNAFFWQKSYDKNDDRNQIRYVTKVSSAATSWQLSHKNAKQLSNQLTAKDMTNNSPITRPSKTVDLHWNWQKNIDLCEKRTIGSHKGFLKGVYSNTYKEGAPTSPTSPTWRLGLSQILWPLKIGAKSFPHGPRAFFWGGSTF